MAFLAHGEDPNHGPYSKNIRNGIQFIIENQSSTNGYIGSSMYNHGFATLALAEAYGVLRDEKLALALKDAVELILSAQERNNRGAWRYTPDSQDADTTVTGAQMVAFTRPAMRAFPFLRKPSRKGTPSSSAAGDQMEAMATPRLAAANPPSPLSVRSVSPLQRKKRARAIRPASTISAGGSIIGTAFIPTISSITCHKRSFMPMRRFGANGMRRIFAISPPCRAVKGHGQETRVPLSAPRAPSSPLPLNYRFLPIYEK